MEKKGFEVFQAESVQKGIQSVKEKKLGFAVVDLRLADGNGLEVVKQIQISNSTSRIVMLTGYGNIPTAVASIKEGAIDYLAKPADADDVEKALLADPEKKAEPPENPMSADRVKWEHIHRVFELCNRNVSETFLLHSSKTLCICSHFTLSADIGFSGGAAFLVGSANKAFSTSSASAGLAR
jgi:two-component system response regulator RegA